MLGDFDYDTLIKRYGGKYQLAMLAAKRARDLNEGSLPLVEIGSSKATVIALKELAEDYLKLEEAEGAEAKPSE